MGYECPNCGRKELVDRGANTLRNIRLRKKDNRYDDFYCENCKETFDEEEVSFIFTEETDATEATEW